MILSRRTRRRDYFRQVRKLSDLKRHKVPGKRPGDVLDHVVPIAFGFTHDLKIEEIASLENLQWLSWAENCDKGTKLTPRGFEILRLWEYFDLADRFESRKITRTH